MSDRNRHVCRGFPVGRVGRGAPERTTGCRKGVHDALRRSGGRPTLDSLPPEDVEGADRDFEGTRSMLRAAALSLICAVLAITAAACGESGSGGDADPASLVPAGAALYAQAAVQPTGDRRDDALAAAGKILRTDDPAGKLRELIDKALAEEGDGFTWEKDFAPWLGEDAGVWAPNLRGRRARASRSIVATKDAEAAAGGARAVRGQTRRQLVTKRSYNGRRLRGRRRRHRRRHGRRLRRGRRPRRRSSGPSTARGRRAALADSDRYKKAIGDLEDDRLGHYYVDSSRSLDAALSRNPRSAAAARADQVVHPVRQARPAHRLVLGRRRRHGARHGAHRRARGAVPQRSARSGRAARPSCSASCPATRGRRSRRRSSARRPRRCSTRSPARSAARRSARRCSRRPGSNLQEDIFSWIGDVGVFVRGDDGGRARRRARDPVTDDAKARDGVRQARSG